MHVTDFGGTALHTMISRGHEESVKAMLADMWKALDKNALRDVVNVQVGKDQLGCVDLALKNMKSLVEPLKKAGGEEQQRAPSDWVAGRRRERGFSDNRRYEYKTWSRHQYREPRHWYQEP